MIEINSLRTNRAKVAQFTHSMLEKHIFDLDIPMSEGRLESVKGFDSRGDLLF